MFKLPQTRRFMKLILILAGIGLFLALITAPLMPEVFVVALICIILLVIGLALILKIFEWICFGSDD